MGLVSRHSVLQMCVCVCLYVHGIYKFMAFFQALFMLYGSLGGFGRPFLLHILLDPVDEGNLVRWQVYAVCIRYKKDFAGKTKGWEISERLWTANSAIRTGSSRGWKLFQRNCAVVWLSYRRRPTYIGANTAINIYGYRPPIPNIQSCINIIFIFLLPYDYVCLNYSMYALKQYIYNIYSM